MKRLVVLTTMVLFSSLGCSQQHRTADAGISQEEMFQILDEIEGRVSTQGVGGSQNAQIFSALKADSNTAFYFSQVSPNYPLSFGPVASVASFVDYSFLGVPPYVQSFDFQEVRVFFLSGVLDGVETYALAVDFKLLDGQSQTRIFVSENEGSWTHEEFSVAMLSEDGAESISLRTFDLDSHFRDFAPVIQLKVADISSGQEIEIGKFSTLVGFGGQ